MSALICPVCGGELNIDGKSLRCADGHSFDIARQGYVNLLRTTKSGEKIGDSKESARARHLFHSKDYYSSLKSYVTSVMRGTVLDICCGEGYYDDYDGELYGFDISKEMVRLAAASHRGENYSYFVANLSSIPIADGSIDTAVHLFAPFNDREFARVLKSDGLLYSVSVGKNHLAELKSLVYDTPYPNEERAPETELLELRDTVRITDTVRINREDLKLLFSMTPYFYHTSDSDKAKLDNASELDLTLEFVVYVFGRKNG